MPKLDDEDRDRVPDGIAVSPMGERVAIECELSAKTPQRYKVICASYLRMRKAGVPFSEVHYICRDEKMRKGMERMFRGIKELNVGGTTYALKDEHYDFFKFHSMESWPG